MSFCLWPLMDPPLSLVSTQTSSRGTRTCTWSPVQYHLWPPFCTAPILATVQSRLLNGGHFTSIAFSPNTFLLYLWNTYLSFKIIDRHDFFQEASLTAPTPSHSDFVLSSHRICYMVLCLPTQACIPKSPDDGWPGFGLTHHPYSQFLQWHLVCVVWHFSVRFWWLLQSHDSSIAIIEP